jgi:hypothetical protein
MGRLIRKRGKTFLSGPAGNVEFYKVGGVTYFKSHAKRYKRSRPKRAVFDILYKSVQIIWGIEKFHVLKGLGYIYFR